MRTKLPLLAATTFLGASLAAYAAGTGMNIVPKPNMDAGYVMQQLRDLGYHDFSAVRQVGNLYEVLAAKGNRAVNLRVDSQTGRITDLAGGRASLQSGLAIMPRRDMTASYVGERLTLHGFDNVHNVHRLGGTWAASAAQDGVPMTVRVDDGTGAVTASASDVQTIPPTANMNTNYVKRQLLAMGYDQVSQVERVGGLFVVKAWDDGQPFNLRIDAKTGRITELSG